MSVAACAALVERGDPDRFLAVMAAPVWCRALLFPLYAFNLEVARAPWVTQEPLIAEMRLQWWRDTVEAMAGAGPVRAHEVALPLAEVVRGQGLPVAVMDRLIAARRWDIHRDGFADQAAMDAYLEETGGGLMWLAALALGAAPSDEAAVRGFGWATGLAGLLRAVPELRARGRQPLVDDGPAALAALARRGFGRMSLDGVSRQARPALLAGWQTAAVLRRAAAAPERVLAGGLALSGFARRGGLLRAAWFGV